MTKSNPIPNEAVTFGDGVMEINLGPQHPSTHGVLRVKLRLEGEIILAAETIIGYLHTGVEKECETRTYHQVFTLVDRLDYMSGPAEEQAFAMTVERLFGTRQKAYRQPNQAGCFFHHSSTESATSPL